MAPQIEYRALRLKPDAVSGRYIAGYAARSGVRSNDLGGWQEQIRAGAFAEALRSGLETFALVNHNLDLMLGRRSAGTLEVNEDRFGLSFRILMPDTQLGHDTLEQIRRGDLNGCSFGFHASKDSWQYIDGTKLRTVESIDSLSDVSVVASPAYPRTSVGIGSTPTVRAANLDYERLRLHEISRP